MKQRRVQIWILGATMAFGFNSYAMITPLVPLYSLELGASAVTIGLLASTLAILPLMFAVTTGVLIDRWGSRRLITAGAFCLFLSPIAVFVWPGIGALFVTQALVGLANLLLVVGGQTFTASLGEGQAREASFGWFTTFVSAGQLLGPVLAGATVDLLSYRTAFMLSGGTSLIALVLSRLLDSDRSSGGSAGSIRDAHDPRRIRRILQINGVSYAIAVSFIIAFSQSTYQAFFPVLLELAAYPVTVIGLLLSFRALVSMLVRPLTPTTVSMLGGRYRTLVVMVLLVAGGMVLVAVNQALPALVLASLLIGVGFGVAPPLSMVVVVDRVRNIEKGFALGVRLTGNRLAQFLSPLALGVLAEWIGLTQMFFTGAILVGTSLFVANGLGHDIEMEHDLP